MKLLSDRLIGPGSPFELVVAGQQPSPMRLFRHAPATLTDVLMRGWQNADKPFLIADGYRVSYGLALHEATRLAHILSSQISIGPGSRIALLLSNSIEWPIYFISAMFCGATVVLLNSDSPALEVEAALTLTRCQYLLTDKEHELMLRATSSARSVPIILGLVNHNALKSSMRPKLALPLPSPSASLSENDIAIVALTSGSTGKPKGVELSHRSVITGLMNMMLGGALMAGRASRESKNPLKRALPLPPCSLMLSPFSHIGGYSQLLLAFWIAGRLVLPRTLEIDHLLEQIDREKVRSLTGANAAILRRIVRANLRTIDTASLTSIYLHGAALHSNLITELTQALPTVSVGTGYGMTETNGSIAVISGLDLLDRPTSVGPILPSVQWRCVDTNTQDVARGKAGEIHVSGPMLMQGYCSDPELTSRALHQGWYKTGDIGYVDGEGFLYILERISNHIANDAAYANGAQIERILHQHRFIDEVAVIEEISSDCNGKWIVAIVAGSMSNEDHRVLQRELASLSSTTGVPIELTLLSTMPRTPSGKIDRRRIALELGA